jgi:hypothetical protein
MKGIIMKSFWLLFYFLAFTIGCDDNGGKKTSNNPPTIISGPSATTQKVATFVKQALTVVANDSDGPNSLTYAWSKISGPGMANFYTPNLAQTEVSFDSAGNYMLEVAISDGVNNVRGSLPITTFGPNTDWRISAFTRSQSSYNPPPDPYTDYPELNLPNPNNPNSDMGLTFEEYTAITKTLHSVPVNNPWWIGLGPCGCSHIKPIEVTISGNLEPYQNNFNWDTPTPAVPPEKQPSHYGLAMVGHQFDSTSSYPSFISIDHYGIRAMPLFNDSASFGSTFRVTGFKVGQQNETVPRIKAVDFSIISIEKIVIILEITHPNFEAAACWLITVANNGPTICEVSLVIYPRITIPTGELGLWTISSMYFKDTGDPNDYAADGDTLQTDSVFTHLVNPTGNEFWELNYPLLIGLKITERRPADTTSPYYTARYWTRPNYYVKIFGEKLHWGIELVHTGYEGYDNVVLTGKNTNILLPATRLEDGSIFLAQMRAERP